MGRHKEWRKIAKKERRRRVRKQMAKERVATTNSILAEQQNWKKELEDITLFELEQIEIANMQEHEKWLTAEKHVLEQWKKLQEQRERMRLQQLEEEIKQRLEWELEQERKRKEQKRIKEIEEENKKKQEMFMNHLEKFLAGDSVEPPEELLVSRETKADCDPCPFFFKTACCRFGDQCSRNHRYPGISKVLLATNFFSHFGLENAHEHDADIMLEYEDSDTYIEYKEFFHDVLPEFEKFGRIVQFKVCNNYEKHLRGNTYVEFAELRCAVAAYRALHTRWYGGRQLSLQFCLINSWKNAICGLQSRKRCPKGRSCNFLHVFRNPNNLFNIIREYQEHSERSRRTPPRSWRWSESPEVELSSERGQRRREERNRRRDKRDYRESTREERRQDTSRSADRHHREERREGTKSKDKDKQDSHTARYEYRDSPRDHTRKSKREYDNHENDSPKQSLHRTSSDRIHRGSS